MEIYEDVLSDIIYSICKAVSEVAGKSGMAYISMVGKNLLKIAEERGAVPAELDDPLESLNKFLKFFVDLEYASRIEANIENDILKIEFENEKLLESEFLLQKEKSTVPPLYVTFTARAFLEKYFSMTLIYHSFVLEEENSEENSYAALKIL
jgi:hypothetical protein